MRRSPSWQAVLRRAHTCMYPVHPFVRLVGHLAGSSGPFILHEILLYGWAWQCVRLSPIHPTPSPAPCPPLPLLVVRNDLSPLHTYIGMIRMGR